MPSPYLTRTPRTLRDMLSLEQRCELAELALTRALTELELTRRARDRAEQRIQEVEARLQEMVRLFDRDAA